MPNTPKPGRRPASLRHTPRPVSVHESTAETAAARRAMLRRFLDDHQLTPAALARSLGLSTPNLFYNFLNGRSNSLSQPVLELIAQRHPTLRISPHPGEDPGVNTCRIVAIAATGLEQPAVRLEPAQQASLAPPFALTSRHADCFGVRVQGHGAERLYPPGSLLICRPVAEGAAPASDGRRLVVSRRRGNGVEVSIRVLRAHGEKVWLLSPSSQPEDQAPLTLDDVAIEGIVLASWQPEPGFTLT